MDVQAEIPAGLAAVHNFIMDHDETDLRHYLDDEEVLVNDYREEDLGGQGTGVIQREERTRAEKERDLMADAMWNSYQEYLEEQEDNID